TISGGVLQIGNGGTAGSIVGNVTVDTGAALAFNRTDDVIYTNLVTGEGSLRQDGAGRLILTGTNTYTGGTTINAGTLQIGNGGATGSIVGNVINNGTLAFNRITALDFSGVISGSGILDQKGPGGLALSGDSSAFAGSTNVEAGGLLVSGTLGNATSTVHVASGAYLSGTGTIGGNTMIADGATLIGTPDETLTFNGDLTLSAHSVVSVSYGADINTSLFDVKGNLALGGTLNVTDFGSNGPGLYQVFHNDGTQSGTIALGTLPGSITDPRKVTLEQTANDVHIVNSFGVTLSVWDGDAGHNNGQVDGGDGIWNVVNNNWTGQPEYKLNGPWNDGDYAIFDVKAGKVTVDNTQGAVSASGMQFAVGGYEITGGDLTLVSSADKPADASTIQVGNGSADDVTNKTTISAKLVSAADAHGMSKTGRGTLILTADNSYVGGTTISGGVLQLGNGGVAGSIQGGINTGVDASHKGTLAINRSGTVSISNVVSGTGNVLIDGPGELTLTGANTYSGGTTISQGVLTVTNDDNMGAAGSNTTIQNGATLRFNGTFESNHNYVLAGDPIQGTATIEIIGTNTGSIMTAITGPGSLTKTGTGTLVLVADSNYAGGTMISGGTLQIGNGGKTGAVAGDINNNGILVFNRSDSVAFANVISGTGVVNQSGLGTLALSKMNTYSGGTIVSAGVLQVSDDRNLGDANGELTVNGGTFENTSTMTTGRTITVAANGGSLQTDGTLTLSGAFDGLASTDGWSKTGTGNLIFETSATGNVGSAILEAGNVTLKGSMSGNYTVNAGTQLDVMGMQNGNVSVNAGGKLAGSGTIGKTVTIADNGILSGTAGQTMAVNGDLLLNASSQINVSLGMKSTTALYDVNGNVTLDGTLNITDKGGFGPGMYRLIDYQGNLTDNMLVIGNTPLNTDSTRMWIDTDTNGKHVDLMNASGVSLNVWEGGNGTWNTRADHSNDVWTDNDDNIKGPYDQGSFALFRGTPGNIAVDNSAGQVSAAGMQFATDGYSLSGSVLNLDSQAGQPIIRVGDGTDAGKLVTATIENELVSTNGINKTDYGTLILAGENHYTGGTTVTGGVLQIGAIDGTSGSIEGNVNLASDANDPGSHGTLVFARGDSATFAGNISGGGDVVQKGSGTTTFTGDNSYSGGLTVERGTAQAGTGGHAFGTGVVKVKEGATADLNNFDTTVGGLVAFDAGVQGGDGNIALGTGKLTVAQNFDSRFSGVISGMGDFTKTGSGDLTLNGINTYTGRTNVEGGSLKQGVNGAFNTGSSGYYVDVNGTLDLGGFDTTLSLLSNAGTVTSGIATAGTVLNIAGNYDGQGGTVVINTVLGNDNSRTDRLKVVGDTSGTTNLKVVNRGGVGGQTINGIEVVDVGGQSNGTFSLVSDYTTKDNQKAIWAGAYAYTLQQGSASGNKDGNWYLVSRYGDSDPSSPPDPVKPTDPDQKPRYGAGVPVYQGYGQNMQALNKLPTLQERVGNRYWTGENGDGQTNGAMVDGNGIWARIEGAHNRLEPQSVTGMKQDINTFIMQAGVDGQFYEDDNGKLVAGITGQYGTAHGNTNSFFGDGYTDTRAWSLGATATWYGNNGFYVDTQGQLTWFDNDLSSDDMNSALATGAKAFGYAMSVEAGQRVAIDDHWSLTPQAQLMWSSLDADAFQDIMGNRVGLDNSNSLTARLGLAANYRNDWTGEDGLMVNTSVYGVANLYQSFLGGMRINVAGVDFDTDNDKTWAGIGAGGTYAWADQKYAVYGEGSINTSLNHFADSYALKATVGFKLKW
ncbi:autotransporter outer membrane beta-barrel domain-containing protein, partial [Brucella anthropi]|uniref:autotransporter outer membrane beta-barrel domain-containing protein n=1 Tax=Brucella anthropi TaxID=529 RepID=UPI0023624AB5